jgi:hypothetical protein
MSQIFPEKKIIATERPRNSRLYEAKKFIIVFIGSRQWKLYWYTPVQYIGLYSSYLTSIFILFSHLRLDASSGVFFEVL